MSESPAGARLNFAMRGDVRASPIEFSWGSQTVTSVTGPFRFEAILQAWRNTVGPSASICSLKRSLGATLTEIARCAPQADREAGQSGR
jgi:hypothetical protein